MQFNTYINIFMIGSAEYKECICRWNYDTPKFQVKSHRSLIFTKNRKKKQKSSKIEIETGSLYRQRCKRTVRTFAYCDETQSAVVRPSSNHRIGQSWSFFVARIGRLRKLAWHIYTPLSINGIQHSALTPVSPLQISIFSSSIFFFFLLIRCAVEFGCGRQAPARQLLKRKSPNAHAWEKYQNDHTGLEEGHMVTIHA